MNDCIFCKIINKEIPTNIIYENDKVLAFLDISPVSLGHTLIIPKKHFVNIFDIEENYLFEIIKIAKKIALAYKKIFGIDNLQLIHNAGKHGQQEISHFHFHLIPRHEGDGINLAHIQNEKLREQFGDFMKQIKDSNFQ
jgi:histidine triad (HIT) family protein